MVNDVKQRLDMINYKEKYPLTFQDQTARRIAEVSERRTRAWKTAELAADLLKKSFAAKRVVVFGSLVVPERFSMWSDVDIAAWGIPPERYFAAVATVTGLSEEFNVDLVDVDACRPALRQAIEEAGVDL